MINVQGEGVDLLNADTNADTSCVSLRARDTAKSDNGTSVKSVAG
jgi:hypothetical protein